MSDLVRNPEDRFSHVPAHLLLAIYFGTSRGGIFVVQCYMCSYKMNVASNFPMGGVMRNLGF